MPFTPYLAVKIFGEELAVPQREELPITISYEIEDESDFRQKKSGTSLGLTLPATPTNTKILGSLYNPGAEDTLPGAGLNAPLDVAIVGDGYEFIKGKAFLLSGKKQGGKPLSFDVNIFGDNADWLIPLMQTKLLDCLSATTHVFSKVNIEASWLFDGTVETQDYWYAPTRSREPFGVWDALDAPDTIFRPDNCRPALSLYWLLFRGFKLAGYRIESNFMDTDYFRRIALPWTWGNFFYITERLLKEMSFLATTPTSTSEPNPGVPGTPWSWQFKSLSGAGSSTVNDVARYDAGNPSEEQFFINNVSTDIGYIGNAASYTYTPATGIMEWTYLPVWAALGIITVGFELRLTASIDVSFNSNASVSIEIFKNGVLYQSIPDVFQASAPTLGTNEDYGTRDSFFQVTDLSPTDTVSVRITYHCFKSTLGFCFLKIFGGGDGLVIDPTPGGASPEDIRSYLKLAFIRRQLGSVIEWQKFDKFSNFDFLNLLRGVIDTFNLQLNTDTVTKTVLIEPTHKYSLTDNLAAAVNPGYYDGNMLDWTDKENIEAESETALFQDYDREVIIQMQDDGNDGILKLLQDRHQSNLTQSKYVFPDNFKKGSRQIINRFFSGTAHYNHDKFKPITGVSPQFICLIPENISNTSNPESETTFAPKLAYYKGMVDRLVYGGWNWDGDTSLDLPFMFAVNYFPGGETDPVLTYCDQRIDDGSGGYVVARGLFKRYFWQRFAIMRHGKKYSSSFLLNNTDVINNLHREFKGIGGQRYQLLRIEAYKPLLCQPCTCVLWKWYPVTAADNANTYPTDASITTGEPVLNTPDIKYARLLCLSTDIPV